MSARGRQYGLRHRSVLPPLANPTAYDGGTYSINFTAPTTYQVVDTAANAVVTSGTYTTASTIAFNGVQVTV